MRDLTPELLLMTDDISGKRARPVERRFAQLIDALERAKARYALCGAMAMGAHGFRRFTADIDVLVAAEDLDRVLAELSTTMRELGRAPDTGPPRQVRLRAKRARGPQAVDVDLLVPVDAVEAWALATAVRARAHGRKVDVACAEALVVMKLTAYLSMPETARGLQHRADAARLLEEGNVDVAGLRQFVRSHPELAREVDRLLSAPRSRGRLE